MEQSQWKAIEQRIKLLLEIDQELKEYVRAVLDSCSKPEEDLLKYRSVIMAIRFKFVVFLCIL
jgi:hypothetical protein